MLDLISKQRKYLKSYPLLDFKYRLSILKELRLEIIKNESLISEALFKDLGKDANESYITEISHVIGELNYLIKNLKSLTKVRKVKTPLSMFPAKSYIKPEQYGLVLVMSPWNYPFLLAMNPLIGAISAGNLVVLKPSEFSLNTNSIIKTIINNVFNKLEVNIIEGGIEETTELLKLKFDYIFFTGSTNVGKIVYNAASNHLTPVTLELGGKSPVVIYKDANIELAAKKIAFGKLINAGQTCIAPDYLFIHESVINTFKEYYIKYVELFYSKDPISNNSYPKIITLKHLNRLKGLINSDEVIYGGNNSDTKLEPTLLLTNINSEIMKEEIFGPILPIITFKDNNEPINYINSKDKPLASYVFTNNTDIKELYINGTSSGALMFNDTVIHFTNQNLPFGGVGSSGLGKYHGKYTFNTFTHYKALVDNKSNIDINLKYPPYTKKKMKLVRKIIK